MPLCGLLSHLPLRSQLVQGMGLSVAKLPVGGVAAPGSRHHSSGGSKGASAGAANGQGDAPDPVAVPWTVDPALERVAGEPMPPPPPSAPQVVANALRDIGGGFPQTSFQARAHTHMASVASPVLQSM
jgi:hypothetical protein